MRARFERPAPQALDFGPAPASDKAVRTAPAEAVGRAVFGESNHPQLEACFRAAQASFPNLYPDYAPRIERHIRQLVPPAATIATIGDGALETAGNLVEAVAATTREFNELGAADMMAGMLAQATRSSRHVRTLVRRGDGPCRDYRAAIGALKQSLASRAVPRNSPRRSAARKKPRGRSRR